VLLDRAARSSVAPWQLGNPRNTASAAQVADFRIPCFGGIHSISSPLPPNDLIRYSADYDNRKTMKTFGTLISEARRAKGLSQKKLICGQLVAYEEEAH